METTLGAEIVFLLRCFIVVVSGLECRFETKYDICGLSALHCTPHPRCFAKRGWILLITLNLAFLGTTKRRQLLALKGFSCFRRELVTGIWLDNIADVNAIVYKCQEISVRLGVRLRFPRSKSRVWSEESGLEFVQTWWRCPGFARCGRSRRGVPASSGRSAGRLASRDRGGWRDRVRRSWPVARRAQGAGHVGRRR
jgi:hypothetical protein